MAIVHTTTTSSTTESRSHSTPGFDLEGFCFQMVVVCFVSVSLFRCFLFVSLVFFTDLFGTHGELPHVEAVAQLVAQQTLHAVPGARGGRRAAGVARPRRRRRRQRLGRLRRRLRPAARRQRALRRRQSAAQGNQVNFLKKKLRHSLHWRPRGSRSTLQIELKLLPIPKKRSAQQ